MNKNTYNRIKLIITVLIIAALLICSVFLNVMGGIGLYMNNYENAGIALFISTFFLILSAVFLRKGGMILPSLFDIIGTVGYIYAIKVLDAIPNAVIPKKTIEHFTGRIYPAASVTVLILFAVILNYFSPEQEAKRDAKLKASYEANDRPLKDNEKIL